MSENERVNQFELIKANLESQGYEGEEYTISILKANIMAFVYAGPIAFICFILFKLFHSSDSTMFGYLDPIFFLVLIILSAFIHELLHGIGWAKSCRNGWKSIHIGIIWKALTPFCSCAEEMTFINYVIGSMLPLLVLGFGGALVAIITGSHLIMIISATNILMAGGDITIMLQLIRHRHKKIVDHPTKCGFWAFVNN